MTDFRYKERYTRSLPHIQAAAATLFVVFRVEQTPASAILLWAGREHFGSVKVSIV